LFSLKPKLRAPHDFFSEFSNPFAPFFPFLSTLQSQLGGLEFRTSRNPIQVAKKKGKQILDQKPPTSGSQHAQFRQKRRRTRESLSHQLDLKAA